MACLVVALVAMHGMRAAAALAMRRLRDFWLNRALLLAGGAVLVGAMHYLGLDGRRTSAALVGIQLYTSPLAFQESITSLAAVLAYWTAMTRVEAFAHGPWMVDLDDATSVALFGVGAVALAVALPRRFPAIIVPLTLPLPLKVPLWNAMVVTVCIALICARLPSLLGALGGGARLGDAGEAVGLDAGAQQRHEPDGGDAEPEEVGWSHEHSQ